jgi:hypothetical protein
MTTPISNNAPEKARIAADKRAENMARSFVNGDLRDLDYAHKTLAEDLISSYIKKNSSFNGYKSTFIRRLKYMLIRLRDPRSSNEMIHLVSQFIMLDRIRRGVGISLKEIGSINNSSEKNSDVTKSTDIFKNPSVLKPSKFPDALVNLLKIPSSSGVNYLKYVKSNIQTVIFANFDSLKELKEFRGLAGVVEPISQIALVNTMTYYYSDELPAFHWDVARHLVHEAAHIEWDWLQGAKPAEPLDDCAGERHAYIMSLNYLSDLLSNIDNLQLHNDLKTIKATMKEIESTINEYNSKLGYCFGDFSLKISSK